MTDMKTVRFLMQVKCLGGANMDVSLILDGVKEPGILLQNADGNGSRPTYHLASFIDSKNVARDFVFNPYFNDYGLSPEETISAADVVRIVDEANKNITVLNGRYELKWVPNDPNIPF